MGVINVPFDAVVGYGVMMMVLWILGQWGWRSARQQVWSWRFDRSWMWQCSVCTYLFIDSRPVRLARCPRCQSLTERDEAQTVVQEEGEER